MRSFSGAPKLYMLGFFPALLEVAKIMWPLKKENPLITKQISCLAHPQRARLSLMRDFVFIDYSAYTQRVQSPLAKPEESSLFSWRDLTGHPDPLGKAAASYLEKVCVHYCWLLMLTEPLDVTIIIISSDEISLLKSQFTINSPHTDTASCATAVHTAGGNVPTPSYFGWWLLTSFSVSV